MTGKFAQTEAILHKIETKYGSISNCPDDDPLMEQMREHQPRRVNNRPITIDATAEIVRLAKAGWVTATIARKTNIGIGKVRAVLRSKHMRAKKPFKYRLTAPSGEVYYVGSMAAFNKMMFDKDWSELTNVHSKLANLGWKMEEGMYEWPKIEKGAFFYQSYMREPVEKKDENSYVFQLMSRGKARGHKLRLRQALTARQMSVHELARACDIGYNSLGRYLSGKTDPTLVSVDRMAKALKVNPAWLVGWSD